MTSRVTEVTGGLPSAYGDGHFSDDGLCRFDGGEGRRGDGGRGTLWPRRRESSVKSDASDWSRAVMTSRGPFGAGAVGVRRRALFGRRTLSFFAVATDVNPAAPATRTRKAVVFDGFNSMAPGVSGRISSFRPI